MYLRGYREQLGSWLGLLPRFRLEAFRLSRQLLSDGFWQKMEENNVALEEQHRQS